MPNYGIKVTKEGKDITSTNIQDYILHSKYPINKTYIFGTGSLTFSDENDTHSDKTVLTVNHNLGCKPLCIFFWNKNNTSYGGDYWFEFQGSPHFCSESIFFKVDNTTFKILYDYNNFAGAGDGTTGISGYSFSFRYYIFIDRGEI